MFVFSFSRFIDQRGPKISSTKTQTLPNLRLNISSYYLSGGVQPRVQAGGHGVDGGVVRVDPKGLHPSPHPDVALERVRVFPSPPLGVPPADYLCRCHRCQKLVQFQRINQASSIILENIENTPIYLTKRQKNIVQRYSSDLSQCFVMVVAKSCEGLLGQ